MSFSAMFPVKPSLTTTSAACARSSRLATWPVDVGRPADLEEPGGEHRAGVPRRGDRPRSSFTDRAAGKEHGAPALLPCSIGGLLVHLDDIVGVDDLETLRERLERLAAPEED